MLIHLLGIRKTLRKIIPPRVRLENTSSTIVANSLGEEKGKKAMAKHHHLTTTIFMHAYSRCGCYNHTTTECCCPKHLILLYQNSLKKPKSNKPRYEAHFNSTEATQVVQSSSLALPEPQNTLGQENTTTTEGMLTLPHKETADDMLIEFFSKYQLGDLA
jgi:hypothetical protein